jgi:hypothetical protein
LHSLPEEINIAKIVNIKKFGIDDQENIFILMKIIDLRGNPLFMPPSWFKDLGPNVKILLDTGILDQNYWEKIFLKAGFLKNKI